MALNLPSATKCYYCGLEDRGVEAAGVWYCPDDLCSGPGAAYFRSTLDSYKECGERHTVDPEEWVDKALAGVGEKRPAVARAICLSAAKMLEDST